MITSSPQSYCKSLQHLSYCFHVDITPKMRTQDDNNNNSGSSNNNKSPQHVRGKKEPVHDVHSPNRGRALGTFPLRATVHNPRYFTRGTRGAIRATRVRSSQHVHSERRPRSGEVEPERLKPPASWRARWFYTDDMSGCLKQGHPTNMYFMHLICIEKSRRQKLALENLHGAVCGSCGVRLIRGR